MGKNAASPGMLPAAFLKEVRDRSRFTHMVVFSVHSNERTTQRLITTREVLKVLQKGSLDDGPNWNGDFGTFEGRLGHFVAGRDLCVVVAIMSGSLKVRVITAYTKGR